MFKRADEVEALRRELAILQAQVAEMPVLREALAVERGRAQRHAPAPAATHPEPPEAVDDATDVLPDLRAFHRAAHRELERARRSGTPVSLALIDIDGFRDLNASAGLEAGDAALAALEHRLRALVRTADLVGRTGADEYALLLVDTEAGAAVACVQRLLDAMADDPTPDPRFSVSVGLAPYRRAQSVEQLLAAAADGLTRARAAGGGRVALRSEEDTPDDAARQDVQLDVAEALAAALHERDEFTGEHSRSVVTMSRAVAEVLGLSATAVDRVGAAALLHDIGKVALPDAILRKDGALDEDEWSRVRELPVIAERILRAIPGLADVARIVRHEHERFDGEGYPDGLRGADIPIGSRIVLVCDSYHAMTSAGPYRRRMSHPEAIRELARCAGTQFDPRVTEALIGHLHQSRQLGLLRADAEHGVLLPVD